MAATSPVGTAPVPAKRRITPILVAPVTASPGASGVATPNGASEPRRVPYDLPEEPSIPSKKRSRDFSSKYAVVLRLFHVVCLF